MRLFQNSGLYPGYLPRLRQLTAGKDSFAAKLKAFLDDRYGAPHFLLPVLSGDPSAFFTNGDDEELQQAWAAEHGMRADASLSDILLAQVEEHRTEVFYNIDPVTYDNEFVRRLPGSVKRTIAWRAAPAAGRDFLEHDLIVNNFPTLLEQYREQGARAEYFAPAHDPAMEEYAEKTERPVDILFVGGYTRHHKRRAAVLEAVADLGNKYRVVFHLDNSRMTRLAETPLGWFGPLAVVRRPKAVRAIAQRPIYGRELYSALGDAKIVINGAIDMAGEDRGNMRCWEAMGCKSLLLTDRGSYPEGMRAGQTMTEYSSPAQVSARAEELLSNDRERIKIAANGFRMISGEYSKGRQWEAFQALVA